MKMIALYVFALSLAMNKKYLFKIRDEIIAELRSFQELDPLYVDTTEVRLLAMDEFQLERALPDLIDYLEGCRSSKITKAVARLVVRYLLHLD